MATWKETPESTQMRKEKGRNGNFVVARPNADRLVFVPSIFLSFLSSKLLRMVNDKGEMADYTCEL